jgi:hypothetical protein
VRSLTIKAGATLAYSGVVTGLDRSVAWTASAAARRDGVLLAGGLSATLTRTPDYATTGNYTLALFAGSAVTGTWLPVDLDSVIIACDVKVFDSQNPDPVLYSETININVAAAITP